MKKAAKWLLLVAIIVIIASITCVAALASDYDTQADALKEMGLFKGTANGYELDRIPTRAEAAVSLVRLLGKESEALAGTYNLPFTDVPDWAKQHVGYLYANKLANGTSDTTFGSGDNCNAQMFTTFMLRALGYSEGTGDFSYTTAQEFALKLGLIQIIDSTGAFTRDNMVALSYTALFQPIKDGDGSILLEKLMKDQAVDNAAANKYLDRYKTLQSLSEALVKSNTSKSVEKTIDMQEQITINGKTQVITGQTITAVIINGTDYRTRTDITTNTDGKIQKSMSYYADGWMYIDTGLNKVKYKAAYNPEDAAQQSGLNQSNDPFYLFDSITKIETDSGVSYKIIFNEAMNDLMESLVSEVLSGMYDNTLTVNSLEYVYNFDKNGNLLGSSMTADVDFTLKIGDETISANMKLQQTERITATGSAVTVTPPPDLDQYKEMIQPADTNITRM
jgi:hypothetical protein